MQPRARFDLRLPDGRTLRLGHRTLVMGVINVTPDSFADGGLRLDPGRAIDDAVTMEAQGADIIDVGGESTRPGASPVSAEEELERVAPVLRGLAQRLHIPVSIDTYKAPVAAAALDFGAAIVNDISALRYDPALTDVVARRNAAIVLMHNRGRSRDMYREARYQDVVSEVREELRAQMQTAIAAGISPERIILDPGLGFGKRAEHTSVLVARLHELASLGQPLLVGPSRKSFLSRLIGDRSPEEREYATAAAVTACVLGGAHIVRVHGVAEMLDAIRVADGLRQDLGFDQEAPL